MRSGLMSSAGRRSARKPMMVGLTKFHVAKTSSWKMKRFTIRLMTFYTMKRWSQTMGSIQFSQKCSKLVSIERSCFFMAITPRAALLVYAS